MKKNKILNKKLNKRNIEILRNIQLLCFIEPKLIKNLSDILKNNLKDENEEKLFDYLNKNWLKLILKYLIIVI